MIKYDKFTQDSLCLSTQTLGHKLFVDVDYYFVCKFLNSFYIFIQIYRTTVQTAFFLPY